MSQTKKRNTPPPLQVWILIALLRHHISNPDMFITHGEIAYSITGLMYEEKLKRKKSVEVKGVKNAMSAARKLARHYGLNIAQDHERSKDPEKIGRKISAIKIADKADIAYVNIELDLLKEREITTKQTRDTVRKISHGQIAIVFPEDVLQKKLLELA